MKAVLSYSYTTQLQHWANREKNNLVSDLFLEPLTNESLAASLDLHTWQLLQKDNGRLTSEAATTNQFCVTATADDQERPSGIVTCYIQFHHPIRPTQKNNNKIINTKLTITN